MKKYKLIQSYPGGPPLNSEVTYSEKHQIYNMNGGSFFTELPKHQVENLPKFWEELIEKDYEILSFKECNKPFNKTWKADTQLKDMFCLVDGKSPFHGSDNLINLGLNIHSVKRLSDGEVFTVGDKISNKDFLWANCHIESFEVKSNINVVVRDREEKAAYPLKSLITLKPIIVTEDGIEVYPGDKYWCIDVNDKSKIYTFGVYGIGGTRTEGYIFFSTEKAAEEYIFMNKPSLSIHEILGLNRELGTNANGEKVLKSELLKIINDVRIIQCNSL